MKPYAPFGRADRAGAMMYSRADDVVGSDPTLAEYGFDRPFVEVEARFADGATRRLRIGNTAPAPTEPTRRGGTYRLAHVEGVPRVFLVNESVLRQYRKKPADLKAAGRRKGPRPGGARADRASARNPPEVSPDRGRRRSAHPSLSASRTSSSTATACRASSSRPGPP